MKCSATRKFRFSNQEAAITAALELDHKDAGHRPLNVYRCVVCGDFHIGHRPKVLALQSPEPVAGTPEALPCWCEPCKRHAREIVRTPSGDRTVCVRHAKRLRAVYEQPIPGVG